MDGIRLISTWKCAVVGLVLISLCSSCLAHQLNCTENKSGRSLACYTCMGRDMMSCETGLTCCKGACFKLEDIKHNLIVKGCVNSNEEDGSMKRRKLDVPLYWANNEHAEGNSYFCKGTDFCNYTPATSSTILSGLVSLLFCLILS
ncbi:hypothetical protein WR25_03232 [Diploscapter pachys]|uniref:Uncharacterized protein n=1 Tax=Diploscapter pachys TaxID=2018661 RepID=A0A2A2JQ09_9BILA|nr:hypothetical protein WR25_03232 [Diploscapter pachys]